MYHLKGKLVHSIPYCIMRYPIELLSYHLIDRQDTHSLPHCETNWCWWRESNPYALFHAQDFKSHVSLHFHHTSIVKLMGYYNPAELGQVAPTSFQYTLTLQGVCGNPKAHFWAGLWATLS